MRKGSLMKWVPMLNMLLGSNAWPLGDVADGGGEGFEGGGDGKWKPSWRTWGL